MIRGRTIGGAVHGEDDGDSAIAVLVDYLDPLRPDPAHERVRWALTTVVPILRRSPGSLPARLVETLALHVRRLSLEAIDVLREVVTEGAPIERLDDVIGVLGFALSLTPLQDRRGRHERLSNLGVAHASRFAHADGDEDLDAAIVAFGSASEAASAEYPDRAMAMYNLGYHLLRRLPRGELPTDLDTAVVALKTAAVVTPPGDPFLPDRLANLGFALGLRFERSGHPADLDALIANLERTIETGAHGSGDGPVLLSKLGRAMLARHDTSGELSHIREAVAALQRAVDATHPDDPVRGERLADLGSACHELYDSTEDLAVLDHAISILEAAADAVPPTHPGLPSPLSNLGNAWAARFERTGDPGDLDRAVAMHRLAVETADPEHPTFPVWAANLGASLERRFLRSAAPHDQDDAIAALRSASRSSTVDDPRRSDRWSRLGAAVLTRWESRSDSADLDEAITAHRAALETMPRDDVDRPRVLSNLAYALASHATRVGDAGGLVEAIARHEEAVAATRPDDPDRPAMLAHLGNALLARFERSGDRHDLEKAVSIHRTAVHETPADRQNRARWLSNLANALSSRSGRTGSLDDLDESVAALWDALAATPDGHADRPAMLSNLGLSLHARYERTGEVADLEAAVDAHRRAIGSAPEGHRSHASWLAHGGSALKARSQRTESLDDIDEAIALLRLALDLTPDDTAERPLVHARLGEALLTRFRLTGGDADLEEVIAIYTDAVASVRDDHPQHPALLSHLGRARFERYEHGGDPRDLDASVNAYRASVGATPRDDPGRGGDLRGLALALWSRADASGSEKDRREAVDAVREAAHSREARPLQRCLAAGAWGQSVSGDEAVEAFRLAVDQLQRVSPRWLDVEEATEQTAGVARMAREATVAFLNNDDVGGAAVVGEQARAVVFSTLLQSRTDLAPLRDARPDLAARLEDALARLDPSHVDGGHPRGADSRRVASAEVDAVVDDVRALPGWHRFFLSPPLEALKQAAAEGPIVVLNVSDERCDAVIITPRSVDHVPLTDLTETSAAQHANRFLSATAVLSVAAEPDAAFAADVALWEEMAWLWDVVTGPVLERLGYRARDDRDYASWPRVWWIPTGPLSILPLHAAGHHARPARRADTPDEDPTPRRERTVIDRVVSSTVPTIGSLLHARNRPAPVGDPATLIVAMPHTPGAADLPAVEIEALRCGAWLRVVHDADVMTLAEPPLGEGAPIRAEVVAELPNRPWVHFAGHGANTPLRPWASALLLADHRTAPLTVTDLAAMHLPDAEHLFLSACTTARTSPAQADEPVQFAAAGLLAGYRHVIATLWTLLDTAEPAQQYYRELAVPGMTPARALHAVIQDQRAIHPAHIHRWAPHTHTGP